MSNNDPSEIRSAGPADWAAIRALLAESKLPVDDLGTDKLETFLVAVVGDEIAGAIGIETFGDTGLLRSLVVADMARRAGLGARLVSALESSARSAGVKSLWLLTIDAESFFERHGYAMAERDHVPDSIRQTDEFSDLCPDTAHLMMKDLSS